jgi:hypothetical protein
MENMDQGKKKFVRKKQLEAVIFSAIVWTIGLLIPPYITSLPSSNNNDGFLIAYLAISKIVTYGIPILCVLFVVALEGMLRKEKAKNSDVSLPSKEG